MARLTLILGGARSGKSNYAQQLATARNLKVLFLATAEAGDLEMTRRIRSHQESRPRIWNTLEVPRSIKDNLIKYNPHEDIIILDCLTLLVSNLLLSLSEGMGEDEAWKVVKEEMDGVLSIIRKLNADWIIVSNEVGLGLVPSNEIGRLYRDLLGKTNQQFASEADEVILLVAGIPLKVK